MATKLTNVLGSRSEKIFELCLTDIDPTGNPSVLFRPGFLGDKWPTLDFYVELVTPHNNEIPIFLAQVKSATKDSNGDLLVKVKKHDVERLLRLTGPTYLFGVHEPTRSVFVKSINLWTGAKTISKISKNNELTRNGLERLFREIRDHWRHVEHKPESSEFI